MMAPFGPRWLSPYRWGLGGWVGSGRQWWPWISLQDEVRAILHLLRSDLAGPVNVTAPDPVTNKEFVKAVGRALRRPVLLPIPRFVFKIILDPQKRIAKKYNVKKYPTFVLLSSRVKELERTRNLRDVPPWVDSPMWHEREYHLPQGALRKASYNELEEGYNPYVGGTR